MSTHLYERSVSRIEHAINLRWQQDRRALLQLRLHRVEPGYRSAFISKTTSGSRPNLRAIVRQSSSRASVRTSYTTARPAARRAVVQGEVLSASRPSGNAVSWHVLSDSSVCAD